MSSKVKREKRAKESPLDETYVKEEIKAKKLERRDQTSIPKY